MMEVLILLAAGAAAAWYVLRSRRPESAPGPAEPETELQEPVLTEALPEETLPVPEAPATEKPRTRPLRRRLGYRARAKRRALRALRKRFGGKVRVAAVSVQPTPRGVADQARAQGAPLPDTLVLVRFTPEGSNERVSFHDPDTGEIRFILPISFLEGTEWVGFQAI